MSCIWLIPLLLPLLAGAQQLLKNTDMEDTGFHNNWYCTDCTLSSSTDHHHGSHSAKVTGRHHDWAGISQNVAVHTNNRYAFRGYVKLLNQSPGNIYDSVEVMMDIEDQNGQHHYEMLGKNPRVIAGKWHLVGGDVWVSTGVKTARLYVQISHHSEVNYLLDDTSFLRVTDTGLPNFPNDANNRINQLRKGNINIRLSNSGVHPSDLTVEVVQTKSKFAFGSALASAPFNDPSNSKYRNFFYDNFEWAVIENALKWPSCEPNRGQLHYNNPDKTISTLRQHGITVRGHNIVWAVDNTVPGWQKHLGSNDLRESVRSRVHSVVGRYKGQLAHWDVNNENLHGSFYASRLHDPNFTEWLFRQAHNVDPNVKLFLNDYNVAMSNEMTVAIEDMALQYKKDNVPIYGIGVQSHMRPPIYLDYLKHRLDEIGKAGLPIWITELDIEEPDENKKATYYENVLRLYFSHPAVEGILLWGFWDKRHWRPKAALANGDNVTPNAAGRRFNHLVRQEWRTHETHPLSRGHTLHVHGFKGNYDLHVKHHNRVIHTKTFTLENRDADIEIHLSGSASSPHVNNVIVG